MRFKQLLFSSPQVMVILSPCLVLPNQSGFLEETIKCPLQIELEETRKIVGTTSESEV